VSFTGIYPDQASSNLTITNNIVFATKSALFHQHFGEFNLVKNNVFADGAEAMTPWPQPDGGIRTDPDAGQPNSFVFSTNIVFLTSGQLFYGNWAESATKPVRSYQFENNTYWHSSQATKGFEFPGDKSFHQWQASGKDRGSVVADPLFQNAGKYDFRVKAGSPALSRGFRNIDTSRVGPSGTTNNNRPR
jgi:hypothetical protein